MTTICLLNISTTWALAVHPEPRFDPLFAFSDPPPSTPICFTAGARRILAIHDTKSTLQRARSILLADRFLNARELAVFRSGVVVSKAEFGAAGIAVGSIMGGLAISKNNASDDGHCDATNHCDPVGIGLRRSAQGYASASTALFAVGGVMLAGGNVLLAVSPSKTNENTAMSLSIGPRSVRIQGRW